MNPRLRSIFIGIGLLTLVIVAIVLIPHGLSLYYQSRGGQHIDYVMRSVEGIRELVCEPLPESNQAAIDEVDRGIANLQRAVRFNRRSAQSYYHLGKAYCLLGEPEEARKNYQQYAELRPDNPLGYIGLGFAYEALGEGENSKNAWVDADLEPHEFNAVGDEYFRVDDYDEAMLWYERALSVGSDSAETWLNIGKTNDALQEYQKALDAYIQAWENDPELSTTALIDSYKRNGDIKSVEKILHIMLDNYPSYHKRFEWWEKLGGIYVESSNWNAVIDTNIQAINEYPDHSLFHLSLGWAYYESSYGVDQALKEFKIVMEIEPDSGYGEFAIARLLSKEKIYNEAEIYFSEAIEKNPNANWWYLERADSAIKAQDIQLAIQVYNELIERYPEYVPAYFGIARAFRRTNQKQFAISNIDKVLNLQKPLNLNQYILSGEIYEWAGEKDKAIQSYLQALVIDPENRSTLEAINRLSER
jgi:tetratricopeptide (TPR) repeat protein